MVGQVNIKEEIITAGQHSVVGILTYGVSGATMPTVVIFNAGVIHKIGPNRLHVKLARRLATEGYNVFRFDYGGQGDSIARTDGPASSSYITNALDLVEKKTGSGGFVLTGICSGAEDAYATAMSDSRIKGVILINGTGLELDLFRKLYPDAEKSIQLRYYKKSMGKADRWLKVLKGKSGALKLSKIKFIFRQLFKKPVPAKQTPAVQATASFEALRKRNIALLLVLAEGSTAYDLIRIAYGDKGLEGIECKILKNVDHIITPIWAQEELFGLVSGWCNRRFKGEG
ncbi:MAG TPA: hypothetical protein VGB56_02615 [Flavisolibacter sp.]|jgi:pimeloyl-ACP methyl ester carboxylesterase